MKKFLYVILFLALSVPAFADNFYVGVLAQLNMNEDDYRKFVIEGRDTVGFNFLSHDDEFFRYYDSLITMQMALNAGEISEVKLPEIVGEYFLRINHSAYKISCVSQVRSTYLAFGFLAKNAALRDRFNTALKAIKEEGILENLRVKYLENFNGEKISLEKFSGAERITIALTGDLPPVDFVRVDGTPAGFNIAIISEVAKKMKVNVNIININSGARSAALASGRADVCLWYKCTKDLNEQPDIPENVILSEPYYEWNKFLHIKKK